MDQREHRIITRKRVVAAAQRPDIVRTPAFVVDERQLELNANAARRAAGGPRSQLLFAMKSFSILSGLERIVQSVDGLHASSLFEARLARRILPRGGLVHLTTPALRREEFGELCGLCDYISFNSITQWEAYRDRVANAVACGLRVNPQLSLLDDDRYDPCRPGSKLGVPLDELSEVARLAPIRLAGISGLLVHSNCDAADLRPLLETVRRLDDGVGPFLQELKWINLGGGYLFDEADSLDPLQEAVELLQKRYGLQVLFEPGAAISRTAGYLVSEVVDVFRSGGVQIAVLDTTVNHMPEVFEYQFEPDVISESPGGRHRYLLAGATCLAGDLFGEYGFDGPLEPGVRVVFENAGAYTMVKASMFNGVNLPAIYTLTDDGHLKLSKVFTYEEYLSRCGAQ